ncbi:MAG TPA: YggS family pyridoxal phosphate-dependent enzyme [Moheibacter sp.]|nr:YggS family pyridoxal phosphate-dependent enzyme [Moheibacter sp.]
MNIVENYQQIKQDLPQEVELITVSKTQSNESIQTLYDAGNLVFGENRVQELIEKQAVLPQDIQWHLIGHLQRNKVKYIAEFVHLIHSVESESLLKEINKQAKRFERTIPCLLQIRIATEETKFGLEAADALVLLTTYASKYSNVEIVGLMGMATFTSDENQVRNEFKALKRIFDDFQKLDERIQVLSMGMSGDYAIAIEEGSNMVRVGSAIFGQR